MKKFVLTWLCLFFSVLFQNSEAWGKEKVKLTDISTLTLYHGKMTTGGRSSPVPQLHCIGGTAGCSAFVPQVVQCHNQGSDGYDVQWECKTDMDNAFRFGKVDVLCEGYDYPDDPYVLKGSCGMEYTLDFTMEGMKKQQGHNYYGGGSSYSTDHSKPAKRNKLGDWILLAIVGLLIYAMYRTCVRSPQYSPTNDDSYGPDAGSGYGSFGASAPPPPPGFRPGFNPGYDAGCGGARPGYSGSSGGGGFWTGAATGGLLGYMFGNRNNAYDQGYRPRSSPTGDAWGGTSSSFTSSSGSSGTRTASGFGGTRRR